MSKGLNSGRRATTLVGLAALILGLAVLLVACGGSGSVSTTTSVGSGTTAITTAGSTTTAAPPTTAGPAGGSTTTTVTPTPISLTDADKAFLQTLVKSIQDNTQPLLDLGGFMVAYQTATDADVAAAEENVEKMGSWVDQVKAMTPSAGLKDTHAVLVQSLSEFQQGFTDLVAGVKAKDDAKIKAATTVISEASRKYQSFGQVFGGLVNQ